MPENWDEKFAFYAAALCRRKKYEEATLIGCIMFEKAIYHLLGNRGITEKNIEDEKPYNQGLLQFAINKVWEIYSNPMENELQNYSNIDLHQIRINRNNIIHNNIKIEDIDSEDIEYMILFVWWVYDKITYSKYDGNMQEINFLTADYTIRKLHRNIDDFEKSSNIDQQNFEGFEIIDFENLNKLRGKIVSLRSKIKTWVSDREYVVLNKNYQNQLDIDSISRVDTTSGYVWMSLSPKLRINSASASILGTPLDLRIYFDIGGDAPKVRKDYYEFLKSGYFSSFKKKLFRGLKKKNDLNNIAIFDIDWYSFRFNSEPLLKISDADMKKRIAMAEEKLSDTDEDSPIPWNRILCGYIIERGKISYQEIKRKLDVIIEFYYYFEHFRRHELGR